MKKAIIIGAGISGLATGCYLQMNGYETEIFEKHNIPGGLCTSWKRGGYNFDGCIHWLMGSSKENVFYKLWSELIDMNQIEFVDHSERVSIEVKDNTDRYGKKVFHLYTDLDKLKDYLLDLSSEDGSPINEFIHAISYVGKFQLPPLADKAPQVRTIKDNVQMIKYLPLLKFMNKWGKISNIDFARRFRSPFLREAFELLYDGIEYTLLMMIMQLSFYSKGCAGYPIGGSLSFAQQLETSYNNHGGIIRYQTGVIKILTENNAAIGVMTEDNQVMHSDIVISAADWNFTIFQALEGNYTDKVIRSLKNQESLKVFESAFLISLGISCLYLDTPHLLRFPLEKPLQLEDGSEYTRMEAHLYNYDKTMAPDGKTALIVTLTTKNADYWIDLRRNNPVRYKERKEWIAKEIIDILDTKIGNIKANLDVVDVATPATIKRFTGNWKGSIQGWMPSDNLFASSPVKNTLPGLKNFYMVGHWMVPGGGLPIALQTGRNLVQILCKKDKKKFQIRKI